MLLEYNKSFQALDNMIILTEEICEFKGIKTDKFSVLTALLLARFYKILLSIRILCATGFEEEAKILQRVLLEIYLTLKYISKDPKTRVHLYINYSNVEYKKALSHIQKHYSESNLQPSDEITEFIETNYKNVKSDYPKKLKWSGISIKKMAEELKDDFVYLYDFIYSDGSAYVHSSARSIEDILLKEGKGFEIKMGPFPFNCTLFIFNIVTLTKDMILLALSIWDLKSEEVMQVFNESVKLLHQELKEPD